MPAVTDIGIDLGTSTVIAYVKGKGILLQEPCLVAYDRDRDTIRAIGEEAEVSEPSLFSSTLIRRSSVAPASG